MNHFFLIEIAAVGVVVLTGLVSFTNGFKGASAIVATVVSTRAMSPESALTLVAVFEFAGASLLGTAVARTVGGSLVHWTTLPIGPRGLVVVAAALIAALSWNLGSRWLPTSSGQTLLGGLLGACVAGWGVRSIVWNTVGLVLLSLVGTPALSFLISAAVTRLLNYFSRDLSLRWNRIYQGLQVLSCIAMSLAYGTNDAQGAMGILTLGLFLGGFGSRTTDFFHIPRWIITMCAFSIAMGVLVGGSRMLRTLGMKLYRISSLQGFGAQFGAAASIFTAASIGLPASTTQAIASSILGAGASLRPKAVRWALAEEMALAWLVTIPATAILGAASFWILELFSKVFRG